MTSEIDSVPKMLDLSRMIIYNIFLTSWTFAYKSNVFSHGQDPVLVLKINRIVGFVANYLCLVFLDYLGGFLPSKPLNR